MAVGGIVSHSDVNTIIAAGRADLCALARGYLVDAYFVRHCADAQDYDLPNWPSQYRRAKEVRMRGAGDRPRIACGRGAGPMRKTLTAAAAPAMLAAALILAAGRPGR